MPDMSDGGLLTQDLLRELHDAVVAAGLGREVLLAGLDRRLTAGFRRASSPGGQVWEDLAALNDIPALGDGSVPLRSWLETAKQLAAPRSQAAVFQKALDVMSANPGPGRAATTPAPVAGAAATAAAPAAAATGPAAADTTGTDILIVTVLREEYTAVLQLLSNTRPVQGRPDAPALYGWRTGTVAREPGGEYRVVLALTGSAGTVTASQAVVRSVERWKPRYVLLVGIAGGLPPDGCAVGDAVVSTKIYGYEYGKVEDGFQPRPDWVYQVDGGLCTSAQAFVAANPGWCAGIVPAPKVLFGPVASGNKVVDNPADPSFAAVLKHWPKLQAVEMEGAGAAAAIDELRTVGVHHVGFLMVRGISDMPRPPGERDGAVAQTGERDANKRRACEVAASFAVRWIAAEWPVEPRAFTDPR